LFHGYPPSKWIFGLGLLGSPGEDEPAVERGSPASAAAAGLDANIGRCARDGITKTDIVIVYEAWQTKSPWWRFRFVGRVLFSIVFHICLIN
jgi:hypothetical protein